MKFIHTGDWHLGRRYGASDLTPAILKQVERVCRLAEEHRADALVVAGDVFDKKLNLPELTKSVARILAPRVRAGLHVLLIPGNHDYREHFRMMREVLGLEEIAARRIHIADRPDVFDICGVQFGVLPYPTREMLGERALQKEPTPSQNAGAPDENAISPLYTEAIRAVHRSLDAARPAVLVAHVTVAGVKTPHGHEIGYNSDLRLGMEDVPHEKLSYIALGHIHQQQKLKHPVEAWYCGSLERLDMGEKGDAKGVLLVEIERAGDNAKVTPLPLEVTPFYDLEIPAAELAERLAEYSDLDRAFVRLRVPCEVGADVQQIRRTARALCPQLVEIEPVGAGALPATFEAPGEADPTQRVIEFLRERFGGDADLPELETRARELMKTCWSDNAPLK